MATSYHHQMLVDHRDLNVIACCNEQIATKFEMASMTVDITKEGAGAAAELEIEAGSYGTTKCFFVQGHPEVGSKEYRSWCMTKLWDHLNEWGVFSKQKKEQDKAHTLGAGIDVVSGPGNIRELPMMCSVDEDNRNHDENVEEYLAKAQVG
jgi:hypothetical protein